MYKRELAHFQLLQFNFFVGFVDLCPGLGKAGAANYFGQHRGPTYFYNNGSKKRQNWWARFTISIANSNHNTKGHRVIKTKDLNKN